MYAKDNGLLVGKSITMSASGSEATGVLRAVNIFCINVDPKCSSGLLGSPGPDVSDTNVTRIGEPVRR